jgi:xylulokinase
VTGPLVLGIDLGTTTCRSAVFDLDGNEVASASVESEIRYPQPSWAEVDPEWWWTATAQVVRETLRRGEIRPEQVAGIGITGLMHAPVLVDGAGQPVAPAILWMDQRCAPQCEAMAREAEAAGLPLGRAFSTTHTAPKLRWFADEQPETLARAQHLLLPKDFIRLRLTGVAGTDASDAGGTGLFDRSANDWAWELVRLARVPFPLLPSIRPAWALAGTVTAEAAAQTGLREATPVAVGGADTYCTRLGAGPLTPGEICLYLGTAAWISRATGTAPDGRPVTAGFGATATTGAALRWARDLLGATTVDDRRPTTDDRRPATEGTHSSSVLRPASNHNLSAAPDIAASYDALTREAAGVVPGAEGLFCLPHLMGERGPQPDPLARGALVGLTLRHRRPHVVRAVLEGTVFQIRRVLEARLGVTPREDGAAPAVTGGVVCGGAARSALWLQLLVDVTGLTLRVPAAVECGALGAAMLGGVAAGLRTLEEAQARMTRIDRTLTPDPATAARYEPLYARYCELDDLLLPWFNKNGGDYQ